MSTCRDPAIYAGVFAVLVLAASACSSVVEETEEVIPGRSCIGSARWTDVTAAIGLPPRWSATASWGDVDADHAPDLYVPPGIGVDPGSHVFYLNRGGVFERADPGRHVRSMPYSAASALADLDGDGLLDVLSASSNRLAVSYNRGDLDFSPAEELWTTDQPGTSIASIGVFDLDGDLAADLYLSRTGAVFGGHRDPLAFNVILHNRQGVFDDASRADPDLLAAGEYPTFASMFASRLAFGDDPLLFIGNDQPRNYAFVHRDRRDYEPFDLPHFTADRATMGVDHSYENDTGDLRIAISDIGALPLFRVDRAGRVHDETSTVGWDGGNAFGWGIVFGDFDNDGVEDLVLAAGMKENYLGGGNVEEPVFDNHMFFFRDARADGVGMPNCSFIAGARFDGTDFGDYYCVATADYDLDGCLDLLATPIQTAVENSATGRNFSVSVTVLHNDCHYAGHWIGLRVPDRVGTMVAITSDGVTRYREVKGAQGVACRGDAGGLHFGLGASSTLESVSVYWPDGARAELDVSVLEVDAWNVIESPAGE